MVSVFYFLIILLQLIFVLFFAGKLRKSGAQTTFHFLLCVLMACLYSFEFVREIRILLGMTVLINESRLIILRIEHTLLGMFLMEVIHYAKILR